MCCVGLACALCCQRISVRQELAIFLKKEENIVVEKGKAFTVMPLQSCGVAERE